MPANRKPPPPPTTGEGALLIRRREEPVRYVLAGPVSQLRPGPARIRGSIETSPEMAEAAFREGETSLRLEDGSLYRLTMLGHTPGSGTAYFEMRR